LTLLDAFAGSGAIGFEALSRGAASVLAIENDKAAQQAMEQAAAQLAVRNHKLVHATVSGWSENNPDKQFDIVIADPPYNHLQLTALKKLGGHVAPGGLFVLSWPGKDQAPVFECMEVIQAKNYGDAQLIFYRQGR
jgi:16S rRNA (guanine966-N2)-methyltransferase